MNKHSKHYSSLFLLLLAVSLSVFVVIFVFIFHTNMQKMLEQSESKSLNRQFEIIEGTMETSLQNLFKLTQDTAIWEESFQFVLGNRPDFFSRNWSDTSLLTSFNLHFVFFKDKNNSDLYVQFNDKYVGREIRQPDALSQYLNPIATEVLNKYVDDFSKGTNSLEFGKSGILIYDSIPYSIAVMPIVSSHEEPQPSGVLIFGNVLDDAYFKSITHSPNANFEMLALYNSSAREIGEVNIERKDGNLISSSILLDDIDGNPLMFRMTTEREIYASGLDILNLTSISLIVLIVLFGCIIFFITNKLILRPMGQLSKDGSKISANRSDRQQ